jgi:hypothetical protein
MPLVFLLFLSWNQVKAQITISGTPIQVSCFGGTNGSVAITALGGLGPYTYTWSPAPGSGQGTANASVMAAGTYTLMVHDISTGVGSYTVTITQPSILGATSSVVNENCNGGTNGSATSIGSGGSAPYLYSWAPPATGNASTSTALAAGTYSCTVTDNMGCTTSVSATITQPPSISGTITAYNNVSCSGGNDGTATVTVTGGTGALTYSWHPTGGSVSTASSLTAGSYTCFITDANGCFSMSASANLSQPSKVLASSVLSSNDPACYAGNTGNASVSVSGGTGAYTYSWNPTGTNTAAASNLIAGTYTCQVTDANGCMTNSTLTLGQPPQLVLNPSFVQSNCNSSTGSASVTVSGGVVPYTYSWTSPISSNSSVSGLPAGTYSVLVTDYNACNMSTSITVTNQMPSLSLAQTNVNCYGSLNGSATASITGGTAPFTYSWSPTPGGGQGSLSATAMGAGTYTFQVTDGHTCNVMATTTISQPLAIAVATSPNSPACSGSANGSIGVTASGGVGAFTYSWNPTPSLGQGTPNASGLSAGTYSCLVTDGNGCAFQATATVTNPNSISLTVNPIQASCGGICDGSIGTTVTGGTPPFTYNWSPSGGTLATASNLCPNTYICQVKDAKGCVSTNGAAISAALSPALTGTVTAPISGQINSGWVYLVQYDTVLKKQHVIDSVVISSGRYNFSNSIGGKFLIYAIANTANYPNTIKTYSAHADQWINASIIKAACGTNDTANISLYELLPVTGGGSFSGKVVKDKGFSSRYGAGGNPSIQTPGDPVPGLDVNLEQHPGGIIAHVKTDNSGSYHFGNVPPGTFEVYVDIPGLGMISQYVRTVSSNEMYSNLNYKVDSAHIHPDTVLVTGLNQPQNTTQNKLFANPNPFTDQFVLNYSLGEQAEVSIVLFNTLGEQVLELKKGIQEAGVYNYPVDAVSLGLSQGIYVLQMRSGSAIFTRRLVRMR